MGKAEETDFGKCFYSYNSLYLLSIFDGPGTVLKLDFHETLQGNYYDRLHFYDAQRGSITCPKSYGNNWQSCALTRRSGPVRSRVA